MLTETWVRWFYTTTSHTAQIKTLHWNTMTKNGRPRTVHIYLFVSVSFPQFMLWSTLLLIAFTDFSDFHHMLCFGSMFAPRFEFHRHLINFQGQLQSLRELIIFTQVCACECVFHLAIKVKCKRQACLIWGRDNKLRQASVGAWVVQENVNFRSETSVKNKMKRRQIAAHLNIKTTWATLGPVE